MRHYEDEDDFGFASPQVESDFAKSVRHLEEYMASIGRPIFYAPSVPNDFLLLTPEDKQFLKDLLISI